MSAAESQPVMTRHEMETALIEKCWKDPAFQKQIVSDPKGTIEKATGQKLPENVKIFVHQEDANTLHFAIPPAPSELTELSDEDLERVAGGTGIPMPQMSVLLSAAQAGVSMKNPWD